MFHLLLRATVLLGLLAFVGFLTTSGAQAKTGTVPLLPLLLPCIDFSSEASCGGFDVDFDSDGFWRDLEEITGSNPNDASRTPEYALYDEQTGLTTCHDGIDNDRDGSIDQRDSGCHVTCSDYAGQGQCADPDQDGFKNYVEVLYGSNPKNHSSTPETFVLPATCEDGIDNDEDGLTDAADCGGIADCIDFDGDADCSPV